MASSMQTSQPTLHIFNVVSRQLGTPWSDGTPGLSQIPIPPGGEWLYKWNANYYGTYWYHSHFHSQIRSVLPLLKSAFNVLTSRSDGMYGPIYIRPQASQKRPFSMISNNSADVAAMMKAEENPNLVVISDWTHETSTELTALSNRTNLDIPCTNSILINGKGSVNCLSAAQQEAVVAPAFKSLYTNQTSGKWLATPSGCSVYNPNIQGNYSVSDTLPSYVIGCCK
jgi:FtsP/CotA-like multicopper oxidase with cupredoxin domain